MNVDIFALFIFSRYSRLSNIRKNMYIMKITCIMPHRDKNIKIANINPREIANFWKCAKIYTRENIYVHSIQELSFREQIVTAFLKGDNSLKQNRITL